MTGLDVAVYPKVQDASSTDLPEGCWQSSGLEGPPKFVSGQVACPPPGCSDLLQLARFCHGRLLFEDAELERCGVERPCPAACSTLHFVGDLALLPGRLIDPHACRCVQTPTPFCCAP